MIGCDLGRAAVFACRGVAPPGAARPHRARRHRVDPGHDLRARRAAAPSRRSWTRRTCSRRTPGWAPRSTCRWRSGPLLGGLFVATLGIRGALAVDAVSFLLSAVVLLRRARAAAGPRAAGSLELHGGYPGGPRVRPPHAVARAVVVDAVPRGGVRRDRQRRAGVLVARGPGRGRVRVRAWWPARSASACSSHRSSCPSGRSRSPRTLFIGGWLLTAAGTLLTGLAPVAVGGGGRTGGRRHRQRRGQRGLRHLDPTERAPGDARPRLRRDVHRGVRRREASRTRPEDRCSMRRRRASSSCVAACRRARRRRAGAS